ncbi:uncharacterized protein LOC143179667 [Calliopsis andreniformis]|uniref:uncharacterized protein LOC143179667 n=1 Tax=Calliopsis andreniformis TaxID=337506 RepID=UPI003FCEB0BB
MHEQRLNERVEFEETYLRYITRAQLLIESLEKSQAVTQPQPMMLQSANDSAPTDSMAAPSSNNALPISQSPLTVSSDLHVKLPTMHLPKFSGSYEAWPGFSDAFRSAVHENPSFRDTQKLIYLRSCLTGKAAEKIESLETTSANYLVAWKILDTYYNDPSIIINNRIQAIFELPTQSRSNVGSLGDLVDQATKHYRALEALNKPFLEAFPIYAITSKLDEPTRLKWKERTHGSVLPTMTELLEFLHDHRKLLEYTRERSNKVATASHHRPEVKAHGFSKPSAKTNFAYATMDVHCNLCKDNHFTSNCAKFKNITVNQRLELVKNAGLCINCLRPNHSAKNCRSGSCKQCNGRHHTLLHKEPNIEEQTATRVNASVLSANIKSETILSTAIVHIVDNKGQLQPCRMLIDSGSQSHFLSERTALRLGLPRKRINIPVIGINRGTTNIKHSVTTTIRSRINKFRTDATFLVIEHITEMLPSRIIAIEELSIPNNIPLADPKFNIPAEIDGLIGGELYLQLLCVGQIRLNHNAIALQKTQFGWILAGRVTALQSTHPVRCNLAKESIHDQLAKFWELEEPYHEAIYSVEERKAEQHFVLNTTRDAQTGRYVVRLPIKDNVPALGESYSMAKRRFCSLERKFSKNVDLNVQYLEFLNEYLRLGHMTLIENSSTDDGYYLPHHAIIKQSSLTTKLRVVFDASAKTSTGTSLNEHLLAGPTVQETLYALLIRFRSHSYVLTADIEKMYR